MGEEVQGNLRVPDHKNDRPTRYMFGKPYHYMQDDAGRLHLYPGAALGETRKEAAAAVASMIDGKGTIGDVLDTLGVPR